MMDTPKLVASPCGLTNLGNTCYINSVLQCIGAVPALRSALGKNNHRSQCQREGYCAACETEAHFETVHQAMEQSVAENELYVVQPRSIAAHVPFLNEDFRLGRQEDAHEFYNALLVGVSSGFVPPGATSLREIDKDTTAIHQLCQGVTASQVVCPKCDYSKISFESFTEGGRKA